MTPGEPSWLALVARARASSAGGRLRKRRLLCAERPWDGGGRARGRFEPAVHESREPVILRLRDAAIVWIAGVGFGVLAGFLSWASRSWTTAAMVVAVVALGALYVRILGMRAGLVVLLIVTSVIDRFTFRAGPVDLRPEEIAALGALLVIAAMWVRERDVSWLRPNLPEILLGAWLACSILSSLLASPDRRFRPRILPPGALCPLGVFFPRPLPRAA